MGEVTLKPIAAFRPNLEVVPLPLKNPVCAPGKGCKSWRVPLWLSKGRLIYSEGAITDKRRLFVPKWRLCWQEGANDAVLGEKGAFS